MKVEFKASFVLVITAENVAENMALRAWADKYFDERRENDASLLITCFEEKEEQKGNE